METDTISTVQPQTTSPEASPVEVTRESQPKKSKTLIIILVVIAVVLFFTTVILIIQNRQLRSQPNIDPVTEPTLQPLTATTTQQQSYTNTQYPYGFSYPSNWLVEENDTGSVTITDIAPNHSLQIDVYPVTGFGYCHKYENQRAIDINGWSATTADGQPSTDATSICDTPPDFANSFVLIPISSDDSLPIQEQIHISYNYPADETIQARQILDQLLENFEVTADPSALDQTTDTTIPSIPLQSTEGWRQVSYKGVSFMIPSEAICLDAEANVDETETNCNRVSRSGDAPYSATHIFVDEYQGGSRRAQFCQRDLDGDGNADNQCEECLAVYEEAYFGEVKALQVAIDGGWCQGGGPVGGIVTVVGDKLVSVTDGMYHKDGEIQRYSPVADTIVSTLQ